MRDFLSRAAANIKEAHKKWQWVLNMEMVVKYKAPPHRFVKLLRQRRKNTAEPYLSSLRH